MLLQILIELGIGGLLVFILMMVAFFRVCFTLFKKYRMHTEACKKTLALMCAVIALLLTGVVEYIWYDPIIFVMFWSVIGLALAIYRRQIRENTYDDSDFMKCDIEYPIKERKKKLRRKNTRMESGTGE